jgi:tRNA (cytidine/uridine-2'-O-)-methyltransferase
MALRVAPLAQPYHVVLIEPEIPPNTGSTARLCAGTASCLHLVGKLGFSLDDRYLKRAGLDYWPAVKLKTHASLEDLMREEKADPARFFYYSTKVNRPYTTAAHRPGDFLVFGKETKGLPEDLVAREDAQGRAYTIPMMCDAVRSLNLATSVGIILFEALRQAEAWNNPSVL